MLWRTLEMIKLWWHLGLIWQLKLLTGDKSMPPRRQWVISVTLAAKCGIVDYPAAYLQQVLWIQTKRFVAVYLVTVGSKRRKTATMTSLSAHRQETLKLRYRQVRTNQRHLHNTDRWEPISDTCTTQTGKNQSATPAQHRQVRTNQRHLHNTDR